MSSLSTVEPSARFSWGGRGQPLIIDLVDAATGQLRASLPTPGDGLVGLAFTENGQNLRAVVSQSVDNTRPDKLVIVDSNVTSGRVTSSRGPVLSSLRIPSPRLARWAGAGICFFANEPGGGSVAPCNALGPRSRPRTGPAAWSCGGERARFRTRWEDPRHRPLRGLDRALGSRAARGVTRKIHTKF